MDPGGDLPRGGRAPSADDESRRILREAAARTSPSLARIWLGPKIWETERLPTLEELRPEKELLEEERVSIRYGREMVRAVGERSHAKSLGEGCGQHEHEAAWATLRGLEDGALEAVAVGFAEHECSALGTELRAGSRSFARLFLSVEGLSLLQAVAKELHGLSLEHCWAWDVVGERREEEYSVVWGVKRLLARIHVVMVKNHLVEDRSNRAVGRRDCCAHTPGICLEYFDESQSVKWWSLHPCMHWVCDPCFNQLIAGPLIQQRQRLQAEAKAEKEMATTQREAATKLEASIQDAGAGQLHGVVQALDRLATETEEKASHLFEESFGTPPVCPHCAETVRDAICKRMVVVGHEGEGQ